MLLVFLVAMSRHTLGFSFLVGGFSIVKGSDLPTMSIFITSSGRFTWG
jgi:hypothetical protein